ncbi:MAG TPA: enoyl-CoA hydratase-related protein [Actinomycetota bacterium]|nr:enoyl-CoA hydratase-related protein [Actinomycetota bacterium]
MTYEQITATREAGVLWLRMNRPDKLNALTTTMSHELEDAVRGAGSDDEVRCVVLTGEGRGFCAGQDLAEVSGEDRPDIAEHLADTYHRLVPTMIALPKPIVAAINGVAAGAGLSLALACDVRLASDAARFTQAFVKIGLIPDSGGTHLLPRVVGYAKALELSITGDLIDAAEAHRIGLVNRVIGAEGFADEVRTYAERLSAMPTLAIGETKKLMLEALTLGLPEALSREAAAQSRMGKTDDHQEGLRAFSEKRDPDFRGK